MISPTTLGKVVRLNRLVPYEDCNGNEGSIIVRRVQESTLWSNREKNVGNFQRGTRQHPLH